MILQPTMPLYPTTVTTVPEDLRDIQPRPYQVWNCDEIVFDPNVSWIKVVFTYKLFTGYRMWRTQTRDREHPSVAKLEPLSELMASDSYHL